MSSKNLNFKAVTFMPYFLNSITPINQFTKTTKEKYFVDKSELIEKMNELVGTASQYVCITRPRRFGKTINAMMLACYYSKNADFKKLFDKLEISKSESYLEHLNKHNVIYMTLNEFPKKNCTYEEFIDRYTNLLLEDLKEGSHSFRSGRRGISARVRMLGRRFALSPWIRSIQ